MTTTPLATIADALIDFILSLLRDPAAVEEFNEDPSATMARSGLGSACLADVRSVAPVIYDRPDVVQRAVGPASTESHASTPVERAISNIVNNYSVDQRATIVDQSVNQNIWAEGDVNQVFDQAAVVNSGDYGAAAGGDAAVDNTSTDVGGDVLVGNDIDETTVDGSFNDSSSETVSDTDTTVTDSYNDNSESTTTDVVVESTYSEPEATQDAPPEPDFDDQP